MHERLDSYCLVYSIGAFLGAFVSRSSSKNTAAVDLFRTCIAQGVVSTVSRTVWPCVAFVSRGVFFSS